MAQYIDKSALVAEINRRIEECNIFYIVADNSNAKDTMEETKREIQHYKSLLDFLDTFDVKEVDLEKEMDEWRHNHFCGERDDKGAAGEWLTRKSQLDIAKHFFVLGLNFQSKDITEALHTEYEKGRADVIADTLSWLDNCWPKYCSNPNIIDAYKEGVVKD